MADDKKNIPEAAPPAEAPAPEPVLTDAEAVMLEHEGQAALFVFRELFQSKLAYSPYVFLR